MLYPGRFPIFTMLFDFSISSNTSLSWEPRNTEMIMGGASLAPSLWALEEDAMDAFSRPLFLYTAIRTTDMKARNLRFSESVLPGPKRPGPSYTPRDQLQCLPDPFTPRYGFSWNRTLKP